MRSRLIAVMMLVILAAAYLALLPRPPVPVTPSQGSPTPRGVIHVHTNRSDGAGSIEDVAAAAARAGLQFVVLTDHGDASRAPNPPRYIDGVLVIDAVEISTDHGHVVALGLSAAAPYPLAGEARDVVDDIHRLGGIAIAAHPGSVKPDLQWSDPAADIDGLEWINGDSEWRDEGVLSLSRALLAYPVRPVGAVTALLDRPASVLAQWDRGLKTRRLSAIAAVDAHARIGLNEPYDGRIAARLPSYESMFRTMSVSLATRLTGDPDADARAVRDAIAGGTFHSTIDGLASPGYLAWSIASGGRVADQGDALPLDGTPTIRVAVAASPAATIRVLRDGDVIFTREGPLVEQPLPNGAGVYRVEVHLAAAPGTPPVPWIVSNPIYLGGEPAAPARAAPDVATAFTEIYGDGESAAAATEQGGPAQAAVDVIPSVTGREILFRYALGGRPSDNSYAALALPVQGVAGVKRLVFTARADRPMRVSVQLRAPGGLDGERWHRSVYVDENTRTIDIPLGDLRPLDAATPERPALERIDSLLFVVDTVNTPLGRSGQVWLDDLRFGR